MLGFVFWDGFKRYYIEVMGKNKKDLHFMRKL